jgi:hypothetical protein
MRLAYPRISLGKVAGSRLADAIIARPLSALLHLKQSAVFLILYESLEEFVSNFSNRSSFYL